MSDTTKAQLEAENAMLRLALERSQKTQKELDSEFFCDKNRELRKLTGLSETAKFFETKHAELAEKLRTRANVEKLTIREFHEQLVEAVQKL